MSFANASLPIQLFANEYGNIGRTYDVIRYVQETSAMSTAISLDPATFLVQGGKKRAVKLNYFPQVCDVEGDCAANICGESEVLEPRQIMFDITRCISSKVYSVDKENVRMTDSAEWDFTGIARAIINSIMPALREKIAQEWLTILYSMAGLHPDGSQYGPRINLVNYNSGVVNGAGLDPIYREFMDSGMQQPTVLGGGDVYAYVNNVRRGGLNANGQRIDLLDTTGVYYDNGMSAKILGNANGDNILAISPNIFKYVYFLRNAGIFATDGIIGLDSFNRLMQAGSETILNTVFVDPVTGIPFDLDIYMSPCNQKINFQLKHNYDFFVMPDVTCSIQGLNGIMHYLTCPPVEVECPSGSPIPSPAAPTVFSWTPGDIYPITVASLSIAGSESQPNTSVANITDLVALLNDSYGPGAMFAASGSTIYYLGYSAISGTINGGEVAITFA